MIYSDEIVENICGAIIMQAVDDYKKAYKDILKFDEQMKRTSYEGMYEYLKYKADKQRNVLDECDKFFRDFFEQDYYIVIHAIHDRINEELQTGITHRNNKWY